MFSFAARIPDMLTGGRGYIGLTAAQMVACYVLHIGKQLIAHPDERLFLFAQKLLPIRFRAQQGQRCFDFLATFAFLCRDCVADCCRHWFPRRLSWCGRGGSGIHSILRRRRGSGLLDRNRDLFFVRTLPGGALRSSGSSRFFSVNNRPRFGRSFLYSRGRLLRGDRNFFRSLPFEGCWGNFPKIRARGADTLTLCCSLCRDNLTATRLLRRGNFRAPGRFNELALARFSSLERSRLDLTDLADSFRGS